MNNKVNYTLIGLFVLLGLVLVFGFAFWMLKPSNDEATQKYLIYFNESVLGLNLDAPVKYRGINVGKVVRLRINPKNTEQVEVTVDILKSTPIKENTVAKLTAQGITGLTYINLTQGKNAAPPLKAKEGEKYPVIKTVPSFFEHFERSLGDVSTQLSQTLFKTQRLLNDANQKQLSLLLERTANVMDKLDRLLNEQTQHNFHNSMRNLESISAKVDATIPKIDIFIDKSIEWEKSINGSFESIKGTYLHMNDTMNNMAQSFSKTERGFNVMSQNVNNTLLESQNVMIDLQNTLQEFEHSPSNILYKKTEQKTAPGER
ncbi:ABC transport system periplasmic substrate binding protein [hydrothermal vent metagenome]|uniref:ABC transport system periplasmic substrate binding protein n=1 Tax=hydrothermal vent metagenome TaxID=652676 RepID=A0A1W1BS93_9ZZZZ